MWSQSACDKHKTLMPRENNHVPLWRGTSSHACRGLGHVSQQTGACYGMCKNFCAVRMCKQSYTREGCREEVPEYLSTQGVSMDWSGGKAETVMQAS